MSTRTSRHNLIKPSLTDVADITGFNSNWDTIDAMLGIAETFRASVLQSGNNLNSKTSVGVYQCKTNAIAQTLSNSPTTNAFSMMVLPHTDGGVVQIVTEYMVTGSKQFRRNLYNGNWGEWVAIATSTDLEGLSGKQNIITGAASSVTAANLTTGRALVSNSNGKIAVSEITATELGYLDNLKSNVQQQLDNKQATVTGGATTVLTSDLTANRALVSNGSGKIAVSAITATELNYLDNLTGNVQSQLNGKASTATATQSANGLLSAADKKKLDGIASGAQVNPGAATQSANGLMSAADKKKLDGIAAGAEVNQHAFGSVKVGSTTLSADAKSDTLNLTAGANVTITGYASDDTVTIAAKDTTYSAATTSANGLMSATDKSKLNGISASAKNVHWVKAVTLTASNGSIQEYSWSLSDLGVSSADEAGERLFINTIAQDRWRHYSYCYISNNKLNVVLASDSTDTTRAKIVVFRID